MIKINICSTHLSRKRNHCCIYFSSHFVITKIMQTVINRIYAFVQIFLLCSYYFSDIFSSFKNSYYFSKVKIFFVWVLLWISLLFLMLSVPCNWWLYFWECTLFGDDNEHGIKSACLGAVIVVHFVCPAWVNGLSCGGYPQHNSRSGALNVVFEGYWGIFCLIFFVRFCFVLFPQGSVKKRV